MLKLSTKEKIVVIWFIITIFLFFAGVDLYFRSKERACRESWEQSVFLNNRCLVDIDGQLIPEDNLIVMKWVSDFSQDKSWN